MTKSCRTLLDGIVDAAALRQHDELAISGVFDDSRKVIPGSMFVAMRGSAADGRAFVADAVARGASVIVGEGVSPVSGVVAFDVHDARLAIAQVAARWFDGRSPTSLGLKLLGVTGTNGKTTTAHMTREILRAAGQKCALLGTVQIDLCGRSFSAEMTTPGPLDLLSYLREAADHGATAAAFEVSSHALDQRRADGLEFCAAAFTNLTQDHLDYHGTMENYAAAKARLFEMLPPGATAIVNGDDAWSERIARDCKARVLRYSIGDRGDIRASVTRDSVSGTLYRMTIGGRELALENAIVGRHNVYNALAAAGLALASGAPIAAIERGLNSLRNVPGRLQRVPLQRPFEVFVDYAHTDDAIRNVASVLRPLTRGRLIIVFGCGGDRDKTKRPKMARAAAEFGDVIIVTSDNPRTEDPARIIDDILPGFDAAARGRVTVEVDRRKAIERTISGAGDGDVVLIAGKGHEDYQIIGREKTHFDDVEVAIQADRMIGVGAVAV